MYYCNHVYVFFLFSSFGFCSQLFVCLFVSLFVSFINSFFSKMAANFKLQVCHSQCLRGHNYESESSWPNYLKSNLKVDGNSPDSCRDFDLL